MEEYIRVPRYLLTKYLINFEHLYENTQNIKCLPLIATLNNMLNECIEKEKQTGNYIDTITIDKTLFDSILFNQDMKSEMGKRLIRTLTKAKKEKQSHLYL